MTFPETNDPSTPVAEAPSAVPLDTSPTIESALKQTVPVDWDEPLDPAVRAVCILLISVGLGAFLVGGFWFPLFTNLNDFHSGWEAGQVFVRGGDPYFRYEEYKRLNRDNYQGNHKLFMYPPLVVIGVLPFGLIPVYEIAKVLWHVVNCLSALAAFLSILWAWGDRHSKLAVSVACLLFGSYYPVWNSLQFGNYDSIVVVCVALAFVGYRKQIPILAGVMLGLGIHLKVSPVFMLLYFLWKRQWKIGITTVVTVGLLLGVTLNAMSWSQHLSYLEMATSMTQSYAATVNQSVEGWSRRLLTHDPIFSRGVMNAPELAHWVSRGLAGLLGLIMAAATFKRGEPDSYREKLGFGLACLTMFMVPEFSNTKHYILGLFPVLVLLSLAMRGRLGALPLVIAGLAHSVLAFFDPPSTSRLLAPQVWQFFIDGLPIIFLSEGLYAVLTLWGVTLVALFRTTEA